MRRAVGLAVLPPLIAFAALMSMAMAAYPGGTWEERETIGHSQVRNFLCDLTRPAALNGVPNERGARYAELGLLAYAVALIPFFLLTPAVFPDRRRLGKVAASCGVLAGVGGICIVMVPSWRYGPVLHGVAVLLTAVPGLTAGLTATIGVFTTRNPIPRIRATAIATLVVTSVAVAVFAAQLARSADTTPGLPVLEKLALGCSVVWMLFTVAATFGSPDQR